MSTAVVSPTVAIQNDQRIVLHGISWDEYMKLHAILAADDTHHLHLTYLDGALEIMSPGMKHENESRIITIFLSIYFEIRGIDFAPSGSMTLREELRAAGAEPDESFFIGEKANVSEHAVPDLAIEVEITSGGINKLEIYRRHGVPEVWRWKSDKLIPYKLDVQGYVQTERSTLLPDLDLELLTRCVQMPSKLQAMRIFREGLRK